MLRPGRPLPPTPDGPATATVARVSATDAADLKGRVEKALAHFLADQRTLLCGIDPALESVCDTIERFVLQGGKRLRPAFAYWGFRGAGGEDSDAVVAAVSALELVQASALIHDDLMAEHGKKLDHIHNVQGVEDEVFTNITDAEDPDHRGGGIRRLEPGAPVQTKSASG